MKIMLIGMGGGDCSSLTLDAALNLKRADRIIGARRLLESIPEQYGAERVDEIYAKKIVEVIKEEPEKKTAVVYSGDTGFYSGAMSIVPLLEEEGIPYEIVPGISSVQLMSARLGRSWENWNLVSAHGREIDPVREVMRGKETFFLTGGALTPDVLCQRLVDAGLGDLNVVAGENLSYDDEQVLRGTAAEFAKKTFRPLTAMVVEPAPKSRFFCAWISDRDFIRGDVPMTKEDVRSAILGKLKLRSDETVWDVGAGTGSVSVEMALSAREGKVYSIEVNPEAVDLIRANRRKFGAWNIVPVPGSAPETFADLPAPDAVFIGGTKGNMKEVVRGILAKNPNARIVASAIVTETLSEAIDEMQARGLCVDVTQISSAGSRRIGNKHMMTANNPIFLIEGESHV